jgi:hypothetical protein
MTAQGDNCRAIWTDKIRAAWSDGVGAVCAVGRLLIDSRRDLPHGQFEKMVETELAFGARTARRLMAIGRDGRIRTHASVLPMSWMTLYELTRLSDEQFQAGIESGAINAEMRRSDVPALCFTSIIEANEALLVSAGSNLVDAIRDFLDDDIDPWAASALAPFADLAATIQTLRGLIQRYESAKEKWLSFVGMDATNVGDMNELAQVALGHLPAAALKTLVEVSDHVGGLVEPCQEIIAACEQRLAELS